MIREREERTAKQKACGLLGDVAKARRAAEEAQAEATERRAGLELIAAKASSGDYAGAVRRERIRAKPEAMDKDQQYEVLKNPSPEVVAALAEMPLGFSPVPSALHVATLEAAFGRKHRDTLARPDAMEKAAEVTLRAAEGAGLIEKELLSDHPLLKSSEVAAEPCAPAAQGRRCYPERYPPNEEAPPKRGIPSSKSLICW